MMYDSKGRSTFVDVPTRTKLWGARSPNDWAPPPGWTKSEWDSHFIVKWKNCVFENTVRSQNEN
jgi:hypothetical protein